MYVRQEPSIKEEKKKNLYQLNIRELPFSRKMLQEMFLSNVRAEEPLPEEMVMHAHKMGKKGSAAGKDTIRRFKGMKPWTLPFRPV